jgi:hypothetical protein
MNMAVVSYIAPCSLVDTDRRFGGAYCLHNKGDKYITLKLHVSVFRVMYAYPVYGGSMLHQNVGQYGATSQKTIILKILRVLLYFGRSISCTDRQFISYT